MAFMNFVIERVYVALKIRDGAPFRAGERRLATDHSSRSQRTSMLGTARAGAEDGRTRQLLWGAAAAPLSCRLGLGGVVHRQEFVLDS